MGEISNQGRVAFLSGIGLLLPLLLIGTMSCGDGGPTELDTTALEVLVVHGDGQAGAPGAPLSVPLQVRVQTRGHGAAVEGVKVRWEIVEGGGGRMTPPTSKTDSLGLASSQLTLGSSLGTYRVRPLIHGMESTIPEFSAEAVLAPELALLPFESVGPGDTIRIGGLNFTPDPEENIVTFSRVRGRVLSATSTELQVEVPSCLLPRNYELRVQIGSLLAGAATLTVEGGPTPLQLPPGGDALIDASRGLGCLYIPDAFGSLYLVVPHSTATVGGAIHPFALVGLTSDGEAPSPSPPALVSPWASTEVVPPAPGTPLSPPPIAYLDARDRLHERLRILEGELLAEGKPGIVEGLQKAPRPSALPVVGDRREFKVLNDREGFDRVKATVRHVTDHSIVYLDDKAPAGGFTDQDLEELITEFENPVYPAVRGVFGEESDLDGNDRVIILFTPAVNRLTDSDVEGFVGGFFFGLDLMMGRSGSNEGEVFYVMVPDPAGSEGTAIPKTTVMNTIPAVLAHEFEHMIHYNQRMLIRGVDSQETLWLSEALAQMAEDLVGTVFEEASNFSKARRYKAGNWVRARRFLENPSQISVLAYRPPGTLEERGAGWLLLKQASGRTGQTGLLKKLVSSELSGIENLTTAMGVSWPELVGEWAGALFLDGTGVPVRPELEFQGVNLRDVLSEFDGSFPLMPRSFGQASALLSGTLWSSAPDYFIINPPDGGLTLSATGPLGGEPEATLGLQLLVVRLQ